MTMARIENHVSRHRLWVALFVQELISVFSSCLSWPLNENKVFSFLYCILCKIFSF